MNQSRLDQLFDLHKEEPEDPFILYAIALEYKKSDLEKSSSYLRKILNEHSDYLAAYYHAAEVFLKQEKYEEAESTLEKGMKVANKQQDFHTFQELNSLFEEFFGEEDDI
jgi:tetratricopeptide (TPR) repeat protein